MSLMPMRIAWPGAALALSALQAAAHAPDETPLHGSGTWSNDTWVLGCLLLAVICFGCGLGRLWQRTRQGRGARLHQAASFASGMAVLAAALLSPIDTLGAQLFSMHMVQHELMMLVAAPLIVAGRPLAVFLWAFPPRLRQALAGWVNTLAFRAAWQVLNAPLIAWSVHAAVLWAWHFPTLFQAGLTSDAVHALQHFSFLVSALLFWSSLMASRSRQRHGSAVLYILSTAIHTGMLGALLTFSPRIWYPAYAQTTEHWGLTALEDQQLGGLIMWVPAGFIFIGAGLAFAAMAMRPGTAQCTK